MYADLRQQVLRGRLVVHHRWQLLFRGALLQRQVLLLRVQVRRRDLLQAVQRLRLGARLDVYVDGAGSPLLSSVWVRVTMQRQGQGHTVKVTGGVGVRVRSGSQPGSESECASESASAFASALHLCLRLRPIGHPDRTVTLA